MSIINTSKPSTSLSNTSRVQSYETWDSISTTWASETRTWDDCLSLMDNVSIGTTGFLWSLRRFPWTESTPWLSEGGITNTSKPA